MWSPVFASYIFKICAAENKDKLLGLIEFFRSAFFNAFYSCFENNPPSN